MTSLKLNWTWKKMVLTREIYGIQNYTKSVIPLNVGKYKPKGKISFHKQCIHKLWSMVAQLLFLFGNLCVPPI